MIRITVLAALLAAPAAADIEETTSDAGVPETVERLTAAIEEAGATVFATVDHGGGAREAGLELAPSQLVIFGNPQIGTPAMQDDPRAGLFLPLKMLVFENEDGETVVAYEEVAGTFDELDIDDDAEYLERMEGALENFAGAASGG